MNFYVVVEGEIVEVEAYKKWVAYLRPDLSYVGHISEIEEDNFSIVSGYGYPQYFEVINDAILDVNEHGNIDRLIFAVDTEDLTVQEKQAEIEKNVDIGNCRSDFRVVLQNFCIETWALGNIKIGPRNPKSQILREYKRIWDVLTMDPECLPALSDDKMNRAKFAFKYLVALLQEKKKGLTYSKRRPDEILKMTYFNEIKRRFENTDHLNSFETFLSAFL